jgi:NADH:ubiquinone oxidoreductase subunit F (NADH-binding)
MKSPEINTWENGQRFADVVNQIADKQFQNQEPRALMGWNGIMIWDRDVDVVDMLHAYLKRVADESCGQCTPCREGTQQLARIMDSMCEGKGIEEDLDSIRSLVTLIGLSARCDIGRTLARPVMDLLDQFKDDFDDVIHKKRSVRDRKSVV